MKRSVLLILVFALIISGLAVNQAVSKGKAQKNYVKVVYFHSDYRCATCNKLEAFSDESVNKYFAKDMKVGKVVWEIINYEKKENEHYVDQFDLYNKSLIIMKYENGKLKKWKNLEKIWEYVGDKAKYFDYVKKEIEDYQKG